MSDNGSVFTSEEFAEFVTKNGINHVKVAPYHPASNGLAERSIQTMKENILRQKEGNLETKLARFLFAYRNTPQSTTKISPAELMFGRKPKTRLDFMHPDLQSKVVSNQMRQKENHDKAHSQYRSFKCEENVYARNYFKNAPKWTEGIISRVLGPVSYKVLLKDGVEVK